MHPPSAVKRCRILLGLRMRLLLRSRSAKPIAFVFTIIVNVTLFACAGLMALGTALGVNHQPDVAPAMLASAFGSVFLAQCILTLVGMAVSEFFDVNRIMHLPVAAREVFAAMALAGLVSVMTPLYASTSVGVAIATGGGALVIAARFLCVLAALALGHLVSLALFFLMSTAMTRRRMRDLAVVLGSLIGIGAYIGFRMLDMNYIEPHRMGELLNIEAPAFYAWLPTAGLLDLWHADFTGWAPLRIVFSLGVGVVAFRFGASRLQLMLDGEIGPPTAEPALHTETREVRWLPRITGASMLLHMRLLWRDPQLRMQWIQQVVFICLPWVFMAIRSEDEALDPQPLFVWWLPAMFALARAGFHHGLFGADGKGLTLLLMAPAPRVQLVSGRMLAVLLLCIPIDLLLTTVLLVLLGVLNGSPLYLLPMLPRVAVGLIVFHTLAVSVGAVFSARWPFPLATADRKRMLKSGQGQGCVTTLIKLFCFLPEFAVAGLLTAIAIAPVTNFPFVGELLPGWALAITLPVVLAICILLAVAGCVIAARTLESREEEFLQALRETGD